MLENEGRGERRKNRKKGKKGQIVRGIKMNFQAATASLLRSSNLTRSLTFDCFATRERGEWSLLENERRGERRKKRKKEGRKRTDCQRHNRGTFKLRQQLCCAPLASRDLSPVGSVLQQKKEENGGW